MTTKELIVRTALKLFLQHGFHNTSMVMIANMIGISKPAIYYHFKNKDEMVHGVLDYFTDKMGEWSSDYFPPSNSAKEFFEKIFQAIPVFMNVELVLLEEKNKRYSYSYNDLIGILSKYKPEFRKRISQDVLNIRKILEQKIIVAQEENLIRPDLQPSRLAVFIQTIIEGSIFICELDQKLNINFVSNDNFTILWNLINK
ncbi:MAG: TetR/AcrR family transcriptional regulator [Candidatus Tenebribacter davisii]|jgi:AcrR family transcriptional regulator|nr:TetR/AcrR family transcriptional regulator [Candidatus Tenebribacter davisii]